MNQHESFLPYNLPDISDAEVDAVVETLRSGWLAPGPRVRRFEEDFAAFTGAKHAIALDSATAGMHLALIASGIGSGDEVITTPTTFAATVNVVLYDRMAKAHKKTKPIEYKEAVLRALTGESPQP